MGRNIVELDYDSFYELFLNQHFDAPKSLGIFYGDYALLQAIYNHPDLNFDEHKILDKRPSVLNWLDSNDTIELNSFLLNGYIKKVYVNLDYTTESDPRGDACDQDADGVLWNVKFNDYCVQVRAATRVSAEYQAIEKREKYWKDKGIEPKPSQIMGVETHNVTSCNTKR